MPDDGNAWLQREIGADVILPVPEIHRQADEDSLRILLIDDDVRLCNSLAAILRVLGYDVVNVYSGAEAYNALESREFDAVIIDVNLPDARGLEILRMIKARADDTGTLMLSGEATLRHAVEALNHGADAFILKPAEPEDLVMKIERVSRVKRLERELRASEARYRELFENIGDGAFQTDLEGSFTAMNMAGAEILGYGSPEEVVDGPFNAWDTYVSRDEFEALRIKVFREGEVNRALRRFRRRDGSLGWLETTVRARRDVRGDAVGMEGIYRDVSDRIRYQEMLEAMYGLWADLGDVETEEEVGELTLDFLKAMIGIDGGRFSVVDGDLIKPVDMLELPGQELPTGQALVARAIRSGKAQLVSEKRDEPGDSGSAGDGDCIFSELAVPVTMEGGVVGVIDVCKSGPSPLTESERKLVEIVADQVSLALARLVKSKLGVSQRVNLEDFR